MGLTRGQAKAVGKMNKAKFKKLTPARLVAAINMFVTEQNKKKKLPLFKITDDKSLKEHGKNTARIWR